MEALMKTQGRNQSIDCCKLIAAVFVVFIHVPFPGNVGVVLGCVGRFAVPVFFAISGYYSFRVSETTLKKRIAHILWLNVLASGVCLIWDCFHNWMQTGKYIPSYLKERLLLSSEEVVDWVFLQVNPFGGHLWYLSAVLLCYVVQWLYHRFYAGKDGNYKIMYLVSLGLLAVNIALGELALFWGIRISKEWVRNFWFFGLPMFSMGLFIRQYENRLMTYRHVNGRTLLALALLGFAVSVLQCLTIGAGNLPVGMLLSAPALLLLAVTHPIVTKNRYLSWLISLFGDTATSVYVIHLVMLAVYEWYLAPYFDRLIPDRGIMTPIFAAVGSVGVCMALQILVRTIKTTVKKNK